jgi:hypothetical protein
MRARTGASAKHASGSTLKASIVVDPAVPMFHSKVPPAIRARCKAQLTALDMETLGGPAAHRGAGEHAQNVVEAAAPASTGPGGRS